MVVAAIHRDRVDMVEHRSRLGDQRGSELAIAQSLGARDVAALLDEIGERRAGRRFVAGGEDAVLAGIRAAPQRSIARGQDEQHRVPGQRERIHAARDQRGQRTRRGHVVVERGDVAGQDRVDRDRHRIARAVRATEIAVELAREGVGVVVVVAPRLADVAAPAIEAMDLRPGRGIEWPRPDCGPCPRPARDRRSARARVLWTLPGGVIVRKRG